jgi:serine/threonine-protein kinase
MSPEQASGEQLDGRSDLYSLGILAFFALSGRFPFERSTASAVVVAHVISAPPSLCSIAAGVPSALGDIVDRLLSKSAGDRYADGQELRAALDAVPIDHSAALVAYGGVSHNSASLPRNSPRALPSPRVADEVMSSADAQQVWARAAELQANTGLIVPPSQFDLSKAAAGSETAGFNAAIVRASALDAGIDARYVDRALAERRVAALPRAGSNAVSVVPIADASRPKNWVLGATTKLDLETSFAGELNESGSKK